MNSFNGNRSKSVALTAGAWLAASPALAATGKVTADAATETIKWTDQVSALAAGATVLLTAILAISTVLLWLSTRRLWKGAEAQAVDFKRSVTASELSSQIAQKSLQTSHRQLIPYLGVKAAMFTITPLNTDGSVGFGVAIELMNFGTTPAYKFRHVCGLRITDYPLSGLAPIEFETIQRYALAPNMQTNINHGGQISPDCWLDMKAGKKCAFISLRFEFEDFSEEKYDETVYLFAATTPVQILVEGITASLNFYST